MTLGEIANYFWDEFNFKFPAAIVKVSSQADFKRRYFARAMYELSMSDSNSTLGISGIMFFCCF